MHAGGTMVHAFDMVFHFRLIVFHPHGDTG
jgi:hypothetical protein